MTKRKKIRFYKIFILVLFYAILFFVLLEIISKKVFIDKYSISKFDSKLETILVIGDSFAAMDHCFPSIIKKNIGDKANVLNIAESGFAPNHYLMNLKLAHKIVKEPKLVLLSIFVGNDILHLDRDYRGKFKEKLEMYLGSRFFSYHVIRWAWINFKYSKRNKEILKESGETDIINPLLISRSVDNPDIILDNLLVEKGIYNDRWKAFEMFLDRIINFTKDQGYQLVVIIIPEHIQVSEKYQKLYKETGYTMMPGTDLLVGPQKRIKALLEKERVPYLDMLPVLKKRDQYDLYFKNDPHLNPKGQAVLGQEILSQGWINF